MSTQAAGMEVGSTFRVTPNGDILPMDWDAPAVFLDEAPEHISVDAPGWSAWSAGRSNQQGYDGPILAPAEFLGGMEVDLRAEPGIYTIQEVRDVSDPDALVGWVILRWTGDGRIHLSGRSIDWSVMGRIRSEGGMPPESRHADISGSMKPELMDAVIETARRMMRG